VYELNVTKKTQIVRTKNTLWGGIGSIEYGTNPVSPVMTTAYNYNNLLQPISIINNNRMSLSYKYDFQGNVIQWTNETMKLLATMDWIAC